MRILVITVCLFTAKPITVLGHFKQHLAERVTYKQSYLIVRESFSISLTHSATTKYPFSSLS